MATKTMLASTPARAECQPPATTNWKPAEVLQVGGSIWVTGITDSGARALDAT